MIHIDPPRYAWLGLGAHAAKRARGVGGKEEKKRNKELAQYFRTTQEESADLRSGVISRQFQRREENSVLFVKNGAEQG